MIVIFYHIYLNLRNIMSKLKALLSENYLSENAVEIWEILSNPVRVSPSPADTETESPQSP